MRSLIHMPLDPASRMVRIALAEKGLPAQLEALPPWEDDGRLASLNPAATIPVLIETIEHEKPTPLSPSFAIIEYLEETYSKPALYPMTARLRAEARRMILWFTDKFEPEVIAMIVRERIDKRLMRNGQPDYDKLRAGLTALDWHMDYFSWVLDQRPWFAGEKYSAADIAAGAYLSCVDYVDAIAWEKFPVVKEWYAKLKSRPAFRPILKDRIEGIPPPRHYTDLDF